jgi:hypothetical protein
MALVEALNALEHISQQQPFDQHLLLFEAFGDGGY